MRKVLTCVVLLFSLMSFAQERVIKPGDTIDITVYNHPELSRTVSVSQQGTIDFPFMQSLPVDGLSLERLREIVITQLGKYLNTYPVVTLTFAKRSTFSVNVLGMVAGPGIVELPINGTLQEAISKAGGTTTGARIQEINLKRQVKDDVITNTYNLEKLMLEGDLKNNPVLQEGDVILVTGNPFTATVKVIGAVYKPGAYDNYLGANLFDMLLLAGGPTNAADLKRVKFISTARKKSFNISLNMEKYLSGTDYSRLPKVEGGDIIIVKEKRQYWKTLISVMGTISSLTVTAYYLMNYIFKD